MAIKPQGIAGLNIGDTQNLLGQMGKPKSIGELAELYGKGLLGKGPKAKNFISPVKSMEQMYGKPKTEGKKALNFLMDIPLAALEGGRLLTGGISSVTNPAGNIIGDFLNQETQEEFDKKKFNVTGPEVFLPDENRNIYGAFSPEGQKKLLDQSQLAEEENAIAGESDTGSDELQKRLSKIAELNDVAEEENNIVSKTTETDESEENLTAAQTATKTALSEFLAQARPGIKPQTYDEYIKEFGDATGLDISGEPDTKQALMSFGLALMQNRAGKGFDLSKILTATGEAGEAAMPDFRKSVAEAKAIRAKAGEYALGKTEKDKNAAMNRQSYVVIPKEGGLASSILKNSGEFTRLNSYELNDLIDNKKFNDEYEIIDSSVYTDMTKSLITAQGKNKTYLTKPRSTPLFSGSDIKIDVFYGDPNVGGGAKPKMASDPKNALAAINKMEIGLKRGEDKFKEIASLLKQTKITAGPQLRSFTKQLAKSFGIKVSSDDKTDPIKQLNVLLTDLKARNAAEILGESGKTISDNDRKLVDSIVGGIDVLSGEADIDLLTTKLTRLYSTVIQSRRDDINEAYSVLGNSGVTVNRGGGATGGTSYEKFEDNQGVIYRRKRPSGT